MSKIRHRQRCPKCGSLSIIRWGVRSRQQRYKCSNCGSLFVVHHEYVSNRNRFVWFRKWVLGKQTIADLARASGHSERQLRRWFDEYLDQVPPWTIQRRKGIRMLIDGTWFDRGHCLIVYRDNTSKSTIFYRFAVNENEYEIIKDLQAFKRLGLNIVSFTTDGADDIIRAIRYAYPHTTRQRCVVHIDVQAFATPGIKILFCVTHDSVRRAYIHLHRAIPHMFKYIEDPGVPNNTNGLESFFGHLKDNLRIHRGMSLEHRDNFVKWYLFFANEKKKYWI